MAEFRGEIDGPAALAREVERLVKAGEAHRTTTVTVNGKEYATGDLVDVRKPETQPNILNMSTLQGFADFARATAKETRDGADYASERGGIFIHVRTPEEINLWTGIFGDFHQRSSLACAKPIVGDFKFGNFLAAEAFTIALLSQFAATEDRERVFRLTGTVESGSSVKTAEDGVTQVVTTKRGIMRGDEPVTGAVFLRPYSTFAEVEQPSRPFVLRMKSSGVPGEPHSCALFEADGGRWRLDAIKSIKAWLKGELGDVVPVYG